MMQRTLLCSALAALALIGCSPANVEPQPQPPSTATATVDDLPMLVKMSAVYNAGDDSEKKFLTDHKLVNGDQIAYYVSPSKDAYVYVIQFLGGEGHLIYPSGGDAKLAAGQKARVPEDGWFQVFGCAGEEFAYVVASEKPLADADAELAGIVEEIKKAPEPKPSCDETGATAGTRSVDTEPTSDPKPQPEPPKPTTPDPVAKPDPAKPDPAKPDPAKPDPAKHPIPHAPPTFAVYAKQKPKFLAFATRSLCTRPECAGGSRALTHVSSVYKGEANEDGVVVLEFFFDHQVGKTKPGKKD